MPSEGHTRPSGRIWLAAVGSSLVAIPAALFTLFLASAFLSSLTRAESPSAEEAVRSVVGLVAVFGPIAFGFYLLAGYWRVALGRTIKGRWFWFSSAGYNAIGAAVMAAAFVIEVTGGNAGVDTEMSLLFVCWTGFMVWLGISMGWTSHSAKDA